MHLVLIIFSSPLDAVALLVHAALFNRKWHHARQQSLVCLHQGCLTA
jgi:hypothetical protein